MTSFRNARICVVPRVSGVGGMVSFKEKFSAAAVQRGVELCYDLADAPYQSVLVIGGSRQLAGLWQARRRGARLVQRLDGMNWLHRVQPLGKQRRPEIRHFLRCEYGNLLLSVIRSRLADRLIYQSAFARDWWQRLHGPAAAPNRVIHNGVDLSLYTPHGSAERPPDRFRLLMVEGSLMGGYELGLEAAVALARQLAGRLQNSPDASLRKGVELMVVGRVGVEVRQRWEQTANILLSWTGLVESARIPELDRSAHLLYSSDINAACPNSVIEALACGLPVLSFDTGALPEMVTGDSGRVAPYGGNPWKLEPPDVGVLVEAALEILTSQEKFRLAARARAEEAFSLERMVQSYLEVLLD